MTTDCTGIGDHLISVHKYRHLTLAGEAEQSDLTDAGCDFNFTETESLGMQCHPHLEAEGRVPELMKLKHSCNDSIPRLVICRFFR